MANTANIQILRSYANSAPTTLLDGQLAYSFKSNTLYIGSNTGGVIAITDQSTANLTKQLSNTIIGIQGVDVSQNVRIDYSNTAITIIQGVDTTQNNRLTVIEGTDVSQNARMTIIEGTDVSQNANITIIQGVDVGQNNRMAIIEGTNASQNVRLDYSNTVITITQGVDVSQNARMLVIENTDVSQNVRLDYSNTAITIIQGTNVSQNARMTIIEGTDVTQNAATAATNQYAQSAFSVANTATVLAQASYNQANVTIGIDTSQNARMVIIEATDVSQNARMTIIEGVDVTQNTSINNKLSLTGALNQTVSGNLTFSNDVTVSGNLYVLGNTTTIRTSQLDIGDSLIYLANNNFLTDSVDIGIIGHYNPGSSNAHTGIFRDPNRKEWIFFQGYQPEVQANNVIDINDPTFAYANVWANTFKGNLIGTTAVVNGQELYAYSTSSYAQANTGTVLAQAAFNQSNTQVLSSGWTSNTVIVANTAGYMTNSNMRWDNVQNQLMLGFTGAGGNLAIGTTSSVAPITVAKTYTTPNGSEQYGTWINTQYNSADTGLKQNLRLNTYSGNTSGTISNVMGILNLMTASGVGGTTSSMYGNWSRNDVVSGAYVTNAYNYFVSESGQTGYANNQYGFYTSSLGKSISNYGFYGAVATGANTAYNLYMAGNAPNYLAGSLTIANNVPSTSNTTGGLIVSGGLGVAGNTYLSALYSGNQNITTPNPSLIFTGTNSLVSLVGTDNSLTAWEPNANGRYLFSNDTNPTGLTFKPDGTIMYLVGTGTNRVYQLPLNTAWNANTAVNTAAFLVTTQDTSGQDIAFKPDGTQMYVVGQTNKKVFQYNLATPWDLNTASFFANSNTAALTVQDATPTGLAFKSDGTQMYVIGSSNDAIYQYTLSTPWSVNTATYTANTFNYSAIEGSAQAVTIDATGSKMWIVGSGAKTIIEFNLSTPWSVSTATIKNKKTVCWDESTPTGLFYSDTANSAYLIGTTQQYVTQFLINKTASEIIANNTVLTGNTTANGSLFVAGNFKTDGTSYFVGATTLGTTSVGGTLTATGQLALTGIAGSGAAFGTSVTSANVTIGTALTSGQIFIGGVNQTGNITFGRSSSGISIDIANGATIANATKLLNIGTSGLLGSNTIINVGPANTAANGIVNILPQTTLNVQNTLTSTSNTTGALVVGGGLGVAGSTYLSGNVTVANTSTGLNTLQISQGYYTQETYIGITNSSTYGSIRYNINPGSGGAGHFFTTYGSPTSQGVIQFAAIATAGGSAVNYLQASANTTGNGPVLSAQGSDTNIDLNLLSKGTSNVVVNSGATGMFKSYGTIGVQVNQYLASGLGYDTIATGAGSYGRIQLYSSATGAMTLQTGFSTGYFSFQTNNALSEQFRITNTASAVNYLQVTGNATGQPPYFLAAGSDGSIGITYATKGTGFHFFSSGGGNYYQFNISNTNSAVNYLQVTGGTANGPNGNGASISVQGSSTDVDMYMTAKGNGRINVASKMIVGNAAVATYYSAIAPFDGLIVANTSTGGAIGFGGTNGRSLSAYQNGTLSNFDMYAAQTYYSGDLLVQGQIKTPNSTSANLRITTTDANATIFIDRTVYIANANSSVSNATGALIVSGGLGVQGNVNLSLTQSQRLQVTTGNYFTAGSDGSSLALYGTGFIYFNSGIVYNQNLLVQRGAISNDTGNNTVLFAGSSPVRLQNTAASISNTTGALIVDGGLGLSGNLSMNLATSSTGTTTSRITLSQANYIYCDDSSGGSIVFGGSRYYYFNAGNLYNQQGFFQRGPIANDTGNNTVLFAGSSAVKIQNGTASTNTTTGALVVQGGVGISGALNATTKSFNIPHPTKEGKDLRYGSLEGPEFGVYVRGTLKDSNVIELPDYWTKLVDANTITVSLTSIGKYQKLSVKEVKDNTIIINSDGWFRKEINCYYVVYGERADVDKLDVEG